jgi:CHAD domain-containing protein
MTTGDVPRQDDRTSSDSVDSSELVHEARKTVKRMRALARMLRYQLGESEFRRANSLLRTAGRRLAGARDVEVRLATLEGLTARHPKALSAEGVERLRDRLISERERSSQAVSPREVLDDIADMRRELASWNLADPDLSALAPGLRRIYREGRHRYARVEHERALDPEHLHDWRKRVKALYYALDMIGASKVNGVRRAARRANRLGDVLGEEHDLGMLCAYVEGHREVFGPDDAARTELLKRIERRRKRLRKRALELGARLYRRRAGSFTRRVCRALAR